MTTRALKRFLMIIVLASAGLYALAQSTVPLGIHYQAVARDNYGNELVNKKISVKFSVIAGDPLSTPVFQEVHQDVVTSRFGVFSLIIGHGTPTGSAPCSDLSQITWDKANHYLKVEVKFDNDFMDMGTMQFLAVPYALYAQKSLEPGPEGPKGDKGEKGEPGDPASDNQTLSFDGSNLTISGTNSTVSMTPLLQNLQVSNDGTGGYNLSLTRGNTINLATIEKDGDPKNEIQDLSYNSSTHELSLLKSTAPVINLTELKNDADADPSNEIQDLKLEGNYLKVTGNAAATSINLLPYLDNTDNQNLALAPSTNTLSISGGNSVSLADYKDNTDSQTLALAPSTNTLSISGGNSVSLSNYLDNTDSQQLTLVPATNTLSISGGNSVNLTDYKDNTDSQTLNYLQGSNELEISGGNKVSLGSMVAFRAKKTSSETVLTWMTDYDFTTNPADYNEGGGYDYSTGVFTAPTAGIYTFSINYTATGTGNSRVIKIFLNGSLYETLNTEIANGSTITREITMKLAAGNHVNVKINVGTGYDIGTGSFSGFKVF